MRRGRGGNRLLSRNLVYVIDTFHLSIYHTTKIRRIIITSNTPLDIIGISFDIIGISFDVIDISFDVIDISWEIEIRG